LGRSLSRVPYPRATPSEPGKTDIDTVAIPVRLFVDTDHRGSGAGRLLLEAAVDFARRQGGS
jgi:GNAT superfamily N-acetyltransferase